jgi:outer membrane protein OmpA-like peptidoglycan-associated protein
MSFNKILSTLFLFIHFIAISQTYDGHLIFTGKNFLNKKQLNNTRIKVTSNNKIIKEINTGEENNFDLKLDFGKTYDIYFLNALAQKMYIKIFADQIPKEKRHYKITYALDIPFFAKDPNLIDTAQFKNPFHQIIFDGDSKFVDDTVYMKSFIKKIYKPIPLVKKDTIAEFLTTEKIKEYIELAGRLQIDNDKKTPLKNKTVTIKNKKGEVVSKTKTTNHGKFSFKNISTTDVQNIEVMLPQTENPNNDKVILTNLNSEKVESVISDPNFNYIFNNTDNNNLIEKLKTKDFSYSIAAKLIATNATYKKIGANKTIYLLNEKNTVIQKTKTNALGIFLFTNIFPDLSYKIAYDSADAELNYIMKLYSIKDKFIRNLDSLSNKKFIYSFISVTGAEFNDLVVDDSELKMNISGRLYGDNKNNPLSEYKVFLLDDKFQTIDSTVTNKDGDFSFNKIQYTQQVMITINNEKSILESFNNILVFDNADNLIKIASIVKGQKFKYKPLTTEFNKLREVYVDDPWLSLIEKKGDENALSLSKNLVIIENILFEFNKADLQAQSQITLDKVVLAMQNNEKFSVELSAHSDSKGSNSYNLKLSEQRANAAKQYIIDKGINSERIIAKGFGETKLLNNCADGVICSEDEHAVNRRLEFKLIFN